MGDYEYIIVVLKAFCHVWSKCFYEIKKKNLAQSRQEICIHKCWRKIKFQAKIIYQAKLSNKRKHEIKTLADKEKLKKVSPTDSH